MIKQPDRNAEKSLKKLFDDYHRLATTMTWTQRKTLSSEILAGIEKQIFLDPAYVMKRINNFFAAISWCIEQESEALKQIHWQAQQILLDDQIKKVIAQQAPEKAIALLEKFSSINIQEQRLTSFREKLMAFIMSCQNDACIGKLLGKNIELSLKDQDKIYRFALDKRSPDLAYKLLYANKFYGKNISEAQQKKLLSIILTKPDPSDLAHASIYKDMLTYKPIKLSWQKRNRLFRLLIDSIGNDRQAARDILHTVHDIPRRFKKILKKKTHTIPLRYIWMLNYGMGYFVLTKILDRLPIETKEDIMLYPVWSEHHDTYISQPLGRCAVYSSRELIKHILKFWASSPFDQEGKISKAVDKVDAGTFTEISSLQFFWKKVLENGVVYEKRIIIVRTGTDSFRVCLGWTGYYSLGRQDGNHYQDFDDYFA